jgi:adenylate cyclase
MGNIEKKDVDTRLNRLLYPSSLAYSVEIMLKLLVLVLMAALSAGTVLGKSKMTHSMPPSNCPNLNLIGNQEEVLQRLLQLRLDHPEQAEEIDAQIHQTFGQRCAVLVMDSSGFSRLAQDQGIVAALSEIERMRQSVIPIMEAHAGLVFKVEIDNVYAIFPSTQAAIQAAQVVMAQPMNTQVSIGVGFGDLITVSSNSLLEGQSHRPIVDVYGEELNLASKLGEDLAGHGEILLTSQAFAQLSPQSTDLTEWERVEHQISGLTLSVYRWSMTAANPR